MFQVKVESVMNKQTKLILDGELLDVRLFEEGAGVILPPDVMARLGIKPGDKLQVAEGSAGEVTLSRFDERRARAMKFAHRAMDEYEETFKILAK